MEKSVVVKEKTISSQNIYSGKIINVKVDTVEIPERGYAKRELVMHPGGACIVAVTEEEKILFVKQFRKAIEKEILELPAGKLEKGEKPEITVVRELKEETGYDAKDVVFLCSFYTSPGFTDEMGNLFFAKAINKGETDFDTDEDIELIEITLQEAERKIRSGEIQDAKTMIGIMMYRNYWENELSK